MKIHGPSSFLTYRDEIVDYFYHEVKTMCIDHGVNSRSVFVPYVPRLIVVDDLNGDRPALRSVEITERLAVKGSLKKMKCVRTENQLEWGKGHRFREVVLLEVRFHSKE